MREIPKIAEGRFYVKYDARSAPHAFKFGTNQIDI